MALYDSPPQVDPATGRLPSYKQVLQQDPTTGMYKIKYEYTPIASSSTQGQTLQTMLTTPITTLPGSTNMGVGSQDGDAEGGDTGDTGVGGATSAATGGGGRDQGGVYDFQRAQRDGGGTPFASDDRSELQKQLDTAYPTVLERGLGIAGGIFLSGVNPVVGKLGTAFMTNQRKNAIEDINQAMEDGTFLSGYKTSEIAKALEDNSNLPDNVADYMRNVISMASTPVKRSTVLEDASTTPVIQAQPGFDPSLMDVSPELATTPLKQTNIGDTIAAADEAAGVQTGDAAIAEAEAPGKDYGWNSTDGSTMTSNSTTTNADGTTTTNPSGLQTANQIVNEGAGGSNNYSQNQVNNAQAQVNGAVKTGGAGYGLPDGVKAVGTGYNSETGNYSGTVSYSGGTVTNDPSKNKKLQDMKERQNRGKDSDGPCFLAGTLIIMADETKKPIEEVELMDKVAIGGYVGGVGKFLTDELYDYNGIKVSGSHLVNEDNKWMHVKDSKNGKPLGNDTHVVYVLGTEHRRLLIENILFTDYLETKEQEMFIAKGSDYFFNNHGSIGNQIAKENLKTLNAEN